MDSSILVLSTLSIITISHTWPRLMCGSICVLIALSFTKWEVNLREGLVVVWSYWLLLFKMKSIFYIITWRCGWRNRYLMLKVASARRVQIPAESVTYTPHHCPWKRHEYIYSPIDELSKRVDCTWFERFEELTWIKKKCRKIIPL